MIAPRPWCRFPLVPLAWLGMLAACAAEPPRTPATLSPAEARRLAADSAALVIDLPALTALDTETARELARFSGVLDLSGLRELEPAIATALAPCSGVLILNGLSTLTPQAAAALARCPGALELSGLQELPPDATRALAAYRGRQLQLSRLVVEQGTGRRVIEELETIPVVVVNDPDVVARRFRRLSAVDVPLLRRLAQTGEWNGAVHAVMSLDAAAAGVLANAPIWDGRLPGVTAIDGADSVAVATALAGRTGPLALPALKKISPRTLSTLLEKEDVEIPRIETLELIPEPDGSPTDDFVIPERFLKNR